MSNVARHPFLMFSGLALLVALSGRNSFGQGTGDRPSTHTEPPPLGLGLGHASNSEVLERIVDRSKGHVMVDPNTLHPPALSPDTNDGFVWREPKPYTCWVVEPGEHGDYAPGTAVACFVRVTLGDRFVNGDGSLLADIRAAKYDGINYNYTTGKAVEMHAHFIEIDTMQPVDGTADNEYTKFLGDDYGPVIGSHGQVLADSGGRIDYSPQLASILYVEGRHPLDVFFAGDPSGILPVCNALK